MKYGLSTARTFLVLGGSALLATTLVACKTTVEGEGLGCKGKVTVELTDEVSNLPDGYALCSQDNPPGSSVCVYCNSDDPSAPRYVQVNCTGGYRKIAPVPRQAGQKGPNPYCPNDTILAGTIKADDEIVMGGNGNVVLEIAFGSDRPVMERTEGLVTAGGAEIARWGKEIPAGVPVVFEGSLDDVLYDAYHMGLVSFSTKSELGHLDITVNQEYSLAEIYVNGRFVAVRPIARD